MTRNWWTADIFPKCCPRFQVRINWRKPTCTSTQSRGMPCFYMACLQLPHANSLLQGTPEQFPFSTINLSHPSACFGVSAKHKWWWLAPCHSQFWINGHCLFSFGGFPLFLHNRFKMLYKLRSDINKYNYDYHFGCYLSNWAWKTFEISKSWFFFFKFKTNGYPKAYIICPVRSLPFDSSLKMPIQKLPI